jgi:hypothetical protein
MVPLNEYPPEVFLLMPIGEMVGLRFASRGQVTATLRRRPAARRS